GLRMSEISRRLMVSGGNVTGITDQLERQHLVTREACPGDRRALTVRLTFHGRKLFAEMAVRHEQWIIELLGGVGRDGKEARIHELGMLKAHLNGSMSMQEPDQRLQPGSGAV